MRRKKLIEHTTALNLIAYQLRNIEPDTLFVDGHQNRLEPIERGHFYFVHLTPGRQRKLSLSQCTNDHWVDSGHRTCHGQHISCERESRPARADRIVGPDNLLFFRFFP
jgi:hypothetical protein